jgi:hypothetical protein
MRNRGPEARSRFPLVKVAFVILVSLHIYIAHFIVKNGKKSSILDLNEILEVQESIAALPDASLSRRRDDTNLTLQQLEPDNDSPIDGEIIEHREKPDSQGGSITALHPVAPTNPGKQGQAATKVDQSSTEANVTISRPACFDNGSHCAYDQVGKYLESQAKFTIIHKPSDAIPSHRRIPASLSFNGTYIKNRRLEGPTDGSLTSLSEYNPHLLPLNEDLDATLLNYLTGRYHPDISDKEADQAKYLYVSRSTNMHNCGASMKRLGNPTKENSYLSLVLLDENLQPIPGASGAVNTFQVIQPSCYDRKDLSPFQDYTIIAARSTKGNDKKDQLFMTGSDRYTIIIPLDIRRVPAPTNDALYWNTKITSVPVPMIVEKGKSSEMFYGNGIQVRFMNNINPPIGAKPCHIVLKYNSMDWKKNYHVFDVPGFNGMASTYMEIRPHWQRTIRKINFYADRFEKYDDWELIPNGTFVKGMKDGHRTETDIQYSKHEPPQQFHAGLHVRSRDGRGTACCVDIEFAQNVTLKVGISHSTTKSRGYLSRFYAFHANSPATAVAMSGPFCLGRMNNETDVDAELQIFPIPDKSMLNASNVLYDCPHVTFPSGITEFQREKEFVVLSYGISDCYARSIVVSKSRIRDYLDINGTESWRQRM